MVTIQHVEITVEISVRLLVINVASFFFLFFIYSVWITWMKPTSLEIQEEEKMYFKTPIKVLYSLLPA